VTGASLDLIIVNETTGTLRKWMGIAAHVGAMTVHGLPDTFELEILNLDLLYNGPAAGGQQARLAGAGGVAGDDFQIDGTDLARITGTTNISISGQLYLNISGFVVALASFSMDQQSGIAVNDTKGVSIPLAPGANVLVIHLSNTYFFVGVDGVVNKNGYANAGDFEAGLRNAGAVGFFAANASLDLAIVGESPAAGGRKWVGVAAHIDSLGVTGLPEGFDLQVKDLQFFYNGAAADGRRMDWQGLAGNGFPLSLGGWRISTIRSISKSPAC
jgi:hypothetical protein